ncbi:MAG: ethyl tert-butyl ether degradation protein EthD [Nitrospiraceae bacterium]|jgi:uncharacterized protein (TIGR02118 family)|nr:ethyl tert-butyl ether degradation protein EthD [Nitrospiraceae bacterium]|tara:strand:- start:1511 stop:1822 length:312 start_codon:yes stop_codon:yes gene_type:complete
MAVSVQVLYPVTETTNFDYDYYFGKHLNIVGETMGAHIQSTLITKGIAGECPDVPAGYYVIATLVFEDQAALDLTLSKADAAFADIPNFTNTKPVVLIGEVVS